MAMVGNKAIKGIIDGVPDSKENPNDGCDPPVETQEIDEEVGEDTSFSESAK